jgi:transposase
MQGFDGGKQIKGRKRDLLVDTLGLLICVLVTAANVHDKTAAKQMLNKLKLPRFQKLFADGAYRNCFPDWLNKTPGWLLEISLNLGKGFGYS